MTYRTITLELLKAQPTLYRELQQQRQLMPTLERLSAELKCGHEEWKQYLSRENPGWDIMTVTSRAMEYAASQLELLLTSSDSTAAAATHA